MTVASDDIASVTARWPLDVVMPVFNEREWPRVAVGAVSESARRAGCDLRIIIVDDGSDDVDSIQTLDELAVRSDVVLVRQRNAGRFAARAAGLARVKTPYVLLLDARVEVDPEALSAIRQGMDSDRLEVWNFDVTPASDSIGASFWSGITKVWWRDYFRDRRHVLFGDEDFDRFPKGTTAFFALSHELREALGAFDTLYDDASLASDDTRLLREVARRHPISLSPSVTCRHHSKSGVRPWVKQCYYRGTTFVDGYLSDRRRARPLLACGVTAALFGAVFATRAPRAALIGLVTGCGAAGTMTRCSGGTPREAAAVAILSPPFGLLFGAGVLRGLRMACRERE